MGYCAFYIKISHNLTWRGYVFKMSFEGKINIFSAAMLVLLCISLVGLVSGIFKIQGGDIDSLKKNQEELQTIKSQLSSLNKSMLMIESKLAENLAEIKKSHAADLNTDVINTDKISETSMSENEKLVEISNTEKSKIELDNHKKKFELLVQKLDAEKGIITRNEINAELESLPHSYQAQIFEKIGDMLDNAEINPQVFFQTN